jgi:hypothetical protein
MCQLMSYMTSLKQLISQFGMVVGANFGKEQAENTLIKELQ